MTDRARELLATYETLSEADQAELAAAILRRTASSGLSDQGLLEVADDLFRSYDEEEAGDAASVEPGRGLAR